MTSPNRYLEVLDRVLDLIEEGNYVKAHLIVSNFFYRKDIKTTVEKRLDEALYFTTHYEPYRGASQTVKSRLAQSLLHVRELPSSSKFVIHRQLDGVFVIAERKTK